MNYILSMAFDTVSGNLQVKAVAGSLVVRITNLTKFLKIKEGDWVEITIKKIPSQEKSE